MGNVTAGGVNDGEDDENEFYEVFILFKAFFVNECTGSMSGSNDLNWVTPIGPSTFLNLL